MRGWQRAREGTEKRELLRKLEDQEGCNRSLCWERRTRWGGYNGVSWGEVRGMAS